MNKIERKDYLGGSDIAAIVGQSPWKGPLQVYLEKTGEVPAQALTSEAVDMGNRLEPIVAELYEERMAAMGTPVTVLRLEGDDGTPGGAVLDPARPWRGGSIDRMVVRDGREDRVLEIKTSRYADGFGEPGTDQVPDHYRIQQAWYQGLPRFAHIDTPTDLALLKGGQEFSLYCLPRDRDLEGVLLEQGEKFWRDHVLARVPPPPDGTDFADGWLRKRFPRVEKPMRRASECPGVNELMTGLQAVRDDIKAKEYEKSVLEQKIKELIGDAEGIAASQWLVTWRQSKESTKIDYKWALQEAIEEFGITEEWLKTFTTTAPGTRRFLPSWK